MKAVVFKSLGGPEVLEIEEREKTEPKPGEALIRVTSAGLNRADCLFRQGRYLIEPTLPSRTGLEPAGVVEAVGEDCPFKVGDRVAALPGIVDVGKQGGFAESVTLEGRILLPTPACVSDEDAGGVWMQYLTAWGALNHAVNVSPGQNVVITAGSSSVALAAVQIVNYLEAVPIVTTTHGEKADKLRENGAAHVINVKEENYTQRVKEITDGEGAHVVFDPVGGTMTAQHLEVIRPAGWIFLYGALEFAPVQINPALMIGKNVNLRGYTVFPLLMDAEGLAVAAKTVTDCLGSGKFKLVIDRRFPLAEIQEAERYMESNVQVGKIVVNP